VKKSIEMEIHVGIGALWGQPFGAAAALPGGVAFLPENVETLVAG
jgi:hypothetical protein